jgi:predicted nucleic acid-binding protein
VVVDSNIWVSRLWPTEPYSVTSDRWLQRQARIGTKISIPNLALAEVAGALARRRDNPQDGLDAVNLIVLRFPGIQVVPLDETLGHRAIELAARLRLKGPDSVYVALAERLGVPLATWDTDVLARAPAVVPTIEPS